MAFSLLRKLLHNECPPKSRTPLTACSLKIPQKTLKLLYFLVLPVLLRVYNWSTLVKNLRECAMTYLELPSGVDVIIFHDAVVRITAIHHYTLLFGQQPLHFRLWLSNLIRQGAFRESWRDWVWQLTEVQLRASIWFTGALIRPQIIQLLMKLHVVTWAEAGIVHASTGRKQLVHILLSVNGFSPSNVCVSNKQAGL